MPYTMTAPTDYDRELAVVALREGAERRAKVAQAAAVEVAQLKDEGRDPRGSAVRVAMVLADAQRLDSMADALARMTDTVDFPLPPAVDDQAAAIVDAATGEPVANANPTPAQAIAMLSGVDDGTSPVAQELAALAALKPDAILLEDPVTGATLEDALDLATGDTTIDLDTPDDGEQPA